MKRILFVIAVLGILGLNACAAPAPTAAPPTAAPPALASDTPLTVYAAASLTTAFKEIAAEFEKANPGSQVEFNFAGSQDLVAQISNGARADVFASADLKNMDALQKQALVGGTPQVFARNKLVVIVPQDNKAGIQTLQDLSKPGVKLVVADKTVPVGNYTLQALDKLSADATYGAGFRDAVLKNVVSQENNVKAVLSKVSLGEADAGVVYSTDAQTAVGKVLTLEIPESFNVLALYPIATVKAAPNAALAEKWIEYILSPQGQAILLKYGFIPPS
ncbi:MAG: Molybdate-binding protein ModA [Anaerolineae bacterium]|nr:Molybdate-binding protein ModA [Anaerolineae bacterium]